MGRIPQFSQLGQQWGEVSCGGMEGNKGGAKAGWVTWAFVGRWWEAPPWPLALNAKQHCHCLTSAAADACAGCFSGNQEQKQPPPALHTYKPFPPCFSGPLCISGLLIHTRQHPPSGNSYTLGAQARQSVTCSHSPDLWCLERVRSQTSGDTQRGCFHV